MYGVFIFVAYLQRLSSSVVNDSIAVSVPAATVSVGEPPDIVGAVVSAVVVFVGGSVVVTVGVIVTFELPDCGDSLP